MIHFLSNDNKTTPKEDRAIIKTTLKHSYARNTTIRWPLVATDLQPRLLSAQLDFCLDTRERKAREKREERRIRGDYREPLHMSNSFPLRQCFPLCLTKKHLNATIVLRATSMLLNLDGALFNYKHCYFEQT